MSIAEFDRYYSSLSDRNDRIEASRPHVYGGNAQVASLRCFMAYHKDARTQVMDIQGRSRWLTHKQVALHGLLARLAVTGEHTTIRAVALEAHVAPSTVSRFMLKLQAWGEYAIDVTRGKYGGITVRRRFHGDHLKAYAEAAWERLRRIADRARLMLRSRSETRGEWLLVAEREPELRTATTKLLMDATLKSAWEKAERDGARLLAEQRAANAQVAPLGRDRGFDPGRLTAANIVAEARDIDSEPEVDYVPTVPFEELVRIFR
jgi:hypothetical protein